MSARRVTEDARASAPVEARPDEDWLWMIAEDPAFYLEERGGAR